MTRLLLLPILLALGGCAGLQTVGQPLDVGKTYRMELSLSVNALKGTGTMVVPAAPTYLIKARAPSDPDLVVISSCGREETLTKQDDSFQYTFTPNALESGRFCPVHISALSAKTWYTGAFIDFQGTDTSVPAKLECNGVETSSAGTMVCQSKAGLLASVQFSVPVDAGVPSTVGCPPLKSDDGINFQVSIPVGECVYRFWKRGDQTQQARLSTIGYQEYITTAR